MLVISRQREESITIGDDVEVTVIDIRNDKVRLGVSVPKYVSVHRKEVYEALRKSNRAAAGVKDQLDPADMNDATAKVAKARSAGAIVRLAEWGDIEAINDIYNDYVENSTCTYQEECETSASRRRWFENHGKPHPITVAELNGQIVGWGSLSSYHSRSAYRFTVENAVYVHQAFRGGGIGSLLLKDLIHRARAIGHHSIIAAIDSEQAPSIALHQRFGFEPVGQFKQVGYKFGRWLDVVYMELVLS